MERRSINFATAQCKLHVFICIPCMFIAATGYLDTWGNLLQESSGRDRQTYYKENLN